MADNLLKNFKVLFALIVIFLAAMMFIFSGVHFGIDFSGGTMFQIHFAEKLKTPAQMEQVSTIIQQRLNWSGLKDIKVFNWGDEFVVAELPETDPKEVQKIESLLQKQGRFEVLLDGNTAFTGEDVIQVDQETGGTPAIQPLEGLVRWNLPFVLKNEAAKNFRNLSFHKCIMTGYSSGGESSHECVYTYFFIDRPTNAVIVIPADKFYAEKEAFFVGNHLLGIPANTEIDEVMKNVQVPYFLLDSNGFTKEQLAELSSLVLTKSKAIVPLDLKEEHKKKLQEIGFILAPAALQDNTPWLWTVSGLKSIVRLQPSITGDDPYVETADQAKIITDLIITGTEQTQEDAMKDRQYTKIILESGSLPVPVESISKESISPLLGEGFLNQGLITGIIVAIVVLLIIFFHYKNVKIAVLITSVAISEAFLALVFTSVFGSITLAAIAGVLAVVGTGVNDQIIITDELLSGSSREELSLVQRIKRAFFMVFAAASTSLATMLPVIMFGTSMIRIMGFAIATVVGVLAGILITRPAYAEVAKHILKEKEQ